MKADDQQSKKYHKLVMGLVVTTKGKVGPEKSGDPQSEATFAKCNYRLCDMELPQAQRSNKPPGFLPKQQFYISERDLIELHFSNAVLSIISPTCQGIQPLAGQVRKRRHGVSATVYMHSRLYLRAEASFFILFFSFRCLFLLCSIFHSMFFFFFLLVLLLHLF